MHVGKLMARLNPKNVRFDVGAGGIPELTSTDIAAALAMVPAGIGRELLCRVWWPDGAAMAANELDNLLLERQLEEWNKREAAMFGALGKVATHTNKLELLEANRAYSRAHKERWPRWITRVEPVEIAPGYELIRKLVLEELAHPRDCPPCHGRGHLMQDGLVKKCERCEGAGVVKYGPTWRARRMGVKESTYRQTWEGPYDWLYRLAIDELAKAERELQRAAA